MEDESISLELNRDLSPISFEVLENLKYESQSRRKLEFQEDHALLDMNISLEAITGQDESQNLNHQTCDINFIHSKIRKEEIPEVGMKFTTEEVAYKFYNAYAYHVGFSVRRCKEHKDRSGRIVTRVFCCSCEGKRVKDKRDINVKCHRAETRFDCLARMKIKYNREKKEYFVIEFAPVHNHMLSSPSKTHLHRSHRNLTVAQAVEADMAYDSGIAPKAILEFMDKEVGGRATLGFIPQDYKNYLRSKRTLQVKVGDTGGVLEYMQKMQLEDPNFFHAIQVDEDDLITNIFWADAKMRDAFSIFGDVVCFDTTYRKHKDGRPFVMFVGVNHHKQTTIFGAALLYDESIESFIWLFDTFARAMNGKTPQTILTDQDAAMAKALVSKWPGTIHRLCIWHIYQNAAIHLSGVFARFKDFSKDFSECIYDYEDEDDFIHAWNAMLFKYNLQNDDWLMRMFRIKEKWALVYGRQTFCADMTTTQRSESMNSALKKYANYKNDLLQFFKNFQRLLDNCRYEELKADFRASQSTPSLSFPVQLLKHAAKIYTPDVFVLFQRELHKAHDCKLRQCEQNETLTKYEITPFSKKRHYIVTYNSSIDMVMCSCEKFEFGGILCSHALKVLSSNDILVIPDHYILKRWTKNAKSGSIEATSTNTSVEDPKRIMRIRYKELSRLCMQLATRAAETEESYKIVLNTLKTIAEEVDASSTKETLHETSNAITKGIPEACEKSARGLKVKKKTSKSSKRPKNALERAIKSKRARVKNFIEHEGQESSPFTKEASNGCKNTTSGSFIGSSNQKIGWNQASQLLQPHDSCAYEYVMSDPGIPQLPSHHLQITNTIKTMPSITELLQAPLSQPIDDNLLFYSFEYGGQQRMK